MRQQADEVETCKPWKNFGFCLSANVETLTKFKHENDQRTRGCWVVTMGIPITSAFILLC